jgi:flagellar basal body rod protein FlgG
MNRGIYATATGMLATQRLMDTIANNLANASTTAFKRDGIAFGDAFEREMRAMGGRGAHLGTLGTGATEIGRYTSQEAGSITATGNPLDVAIRSEEGYFAVQTPQGIRYTRDGAFQVDGEGLLVDKNRHPVLDMNLQPIQLPAGKPQIDAKGTVSANGQAVGELGVFEGQFAKVGESLFAGSQTRPVEEPDLAPGALEGSNVNTVDSRTTLRRS